MIETRHILVEGASVAVRTSGDAGIPLVFCHGNSSSSRSFIRQFESELSADFRLIAIDWPGHGDSDRAAEPESTYTVPGLARVLAAIAAAMALPRAVFVGWSLGGHVLLEASDRLDSAGFLIFGAPPIGSPVPAGAFLPNPAFVAGFTPVNSQEDVERFLESLLKPGATVPAAFREDYHRTDPQVRQILGASLVSGRYRDEVATVATLRTPLAILHGKHDRLVARDYLDRLSVPELWRGSPIEIDDAGHASHWENPAVFTRLLSAFAFECMGA